MLDFYRISDGEKTPEYPDESRYIGSIDLGQYALLEKVFLVCNLENHQISYFNDGRLLSFQVKGYLTCWERAYAKLRVKGDAEVTKAYDAINCILKNAINQGDGIVAFCD